MVQTELNFEVAEPDVKTTLDMVRTILHTGKWCTPWEICDEVYRTRSIRMSDAACTARIRDCRKLQYGGHTVEIRKRHGSKAFEYRMVK
jgi:hypothetical protein